MVENLKTLCEFLALEIEMFDPNLLRNGNLEFISSRLMLNEELPERLNFVHRNHKHNKRYPIASCRSEHCFECLVLRLKSKALKCEHGCELTPFERQHVLYLDQGFKKMVMK